MLVQVETVEYLDQKMAICCRTFISHIGTGLIADQGMPKESNVIESRSQCDNHRTNLM